MTFEQRSKGMIPRICCMGLLVHGLMHCSRDHNFDLRGGWGLRRSYATLTQLELPKLWLSCKELLTHGLTTCIYQQKCCSLRHPGFYAGQPNKRQVFLNTLGEVLDPAHFHPAGSRFMAIPNCVCRSSRLQSDMSGAQGQ